MEPKPPSPPPPYIILKGHVPVHGEPGYDVKGTRYTFRKRTLSRSFFDRPRAKRWLTAEGKISVPPHEHEAFMLEYWAWVDEQDRDARARGRVDSMDHGPTSVMADQGGLFRGMEIEQEEQVLVPGLLSAITNITRPASRGIRRGRSNIPHLPGQGSRRGHSNIPRPSGQGSRRGYSNITRLARPGTARGQVQTHPIGRQHPSWTDYLDDTPYPPGRGVRRGGSSITHPTHPENIIVTGPGQRQTLISEERPAWAGPPPDSNSNPYTLERYAPLTLPPPTHGFAGYVPPQPSGNLYRSPYLDEPYPHSQYTPPTFQPSLQAGYTPPNFQLPPPAGYTPPTLQSPPLARLGPPTLQPLLQGGYTPSNFQPPLPVGYTPPSFQPLQVGYTPPNFQQPPQARYTPPTFQPLLQAGYSPPNLQPPPPPAGYMSPTFPPLLQPSHTPPVFQQSPQARYTATSGALTPQRAPPHAPSPLIPNSALSRPGTSVSAPEQSDHRRGTSNVSSPDSARRRQQERWDQVVEEMDETDEPGSLGRRQR